MGLTLAALSTAASSAAYWEWYARDLGPAVLEQAGLTQPPFRAADSSAIKDISSVGSAGAAASIPGGKQGSGAGSSKVWTGAPFSIYRYAALGARA